jgi:hypothetical protein
MTIPNQKKERIWNDPPTIDNDETTKEITTLKEWLIKIFVTEKCPLYFSITQLLFWSISAFLYQIIPSWIKYASEYKNYTHTYPQWSLISLEFIIPTLLAMLLISGYLGYLIDWKIPHMKKINNKLQKSKSFKSGYYFGIMIYVILIIIFLSLVIFT